MSIFIDFVVTETNYVFLNTLVSTLWEDFLLTLRKMRFEARAWKHFNCTRYCTCSKKMFLRTMTTWVGYVCLFGHWSKIGQRNRDRTLYFVRLRLFDSPI